MNSLCVKKNKANALQHLQQTVIFDLKLQTVFYKKQLNSEQKH